MRLALTIASISFPVKFSEAKFIGKIMLLHRIVICFVKSSAFDQKLISQISSFDEPLAVQRFPGYAAGLVLLSLALPGVPVLRSGDELLAASGTFAWNVDSRDVINVID